ncbi:CDP-alcohol phosphatidyltransferase [Bifidobacterium gallicum DSM 20093 = LMG 11596]|uniref:Phosphatidylinositol phosphate synthase n=2 Tax=Bifidobacterium gallicum DSM 20093 = LMG 11596 TaxID=561180 RepID=D1NTM4_9BIFI|nr:CDP-alcohol phosphatidyltransferase [Bifidobacterium gallicum DSM 20093 = LMG 11596]
MQRAAFIESCGYAAEDGHSEKEDPAMLEKLRPGFKRFIEPIARGLVRLGVTANAVTVVGAVGTTIVGIWAGLTGWLFEGAVVLTLLVIFDSLDGSVAALTTGGTKFGSFLDSTLDRVADWGVMMGVLIYFYMQQVAWSQVTNMTRNDLISIVGMCCTLYAMMTSFVTPYVRAKAESLGVDAKGGIATRSDRLTIILIGMALTGLFHANLILVVTMALLDLLGTITVVQRIMEVDHGIDEEPRQHGQMDAYGYVHEHEETMEAHADER